MLVVEACIKMGCLGTPRGGSEGRDLGPWDMACTEPLLLLIASWVPGTPLCLPTALESRDVHRGTRAV